MGTSFWPFVIIRITNENICVWIISKLSGQLMQGSISDLG
jgi:hypothetical protein